MSYRPYQGRGLDAGSHHRRGGRMPQANPLSSHHYGSAYQQREPLRETQPQRYPRRPVSCSEEDDRPRKRGLGITTRVKNGISGVISFIGGALQGRDESPPSDYNGIFHMEQAREAELEQSINDGDSHVNARKSFRPSHNPPCRISFTNMNESRKDENSRASRDGQPASSQVPSSKRPVRVLHRKRTSNIRSSGLDSKPRRPSLSSFLSGESRKVPENIPEVIKDLTKEFGSPPSSIKPKSRNPGVDTAEESKIEKSEPAKAHRTEDLASRAEISNRKLEAQISPKSAPPLKPIEARLEKLARELKQEQKRLEEEEERPTSEFDQKLYGLNKSVLWQRDHFQSLLDGLDKKMSDRDEAQSIKARDVGMSIEAQRASMQKLKAENEAMHKDMQKTIKEFRSHVKEIELQKESERKSKKKWRERYEERERATAAERKAFVEMVKSLQEKQAKFEEQLAASSAANLQALKTVSQQPSNPQPVPQTQSASSGAPEAKQEKKKLPTVAEEKEEEEGSPQIEKAKSSKEHQGTTVKPFKLDEQKEVVSTANDPKKELPPVLKLEAKVEPPQSEEVKTSPLEKQDTVSSFESERLSTPDKEQEDGLKQSSHDSKNSKMSFGQPQQFNAPSTLQAKPEGASFQFKPPLTPAPTPTTFQFKANPEASSSQPSTNPATSSATAPASTTTTSFQFKPITPTTSSAFAPSSTPQQSTQNSSNQPVAPPQPSQASNPTPPSNPFMASKPSSGVSNPFLASPGQGQASNSNNPFLNPAPAQPSAPPNTFQFSAPPAVPTQNAFGSFQPPTSAQPMQPMQPPVSTGSSGLKANFASPFAKPAGSSNPFAPGLSSLGNDTSMDAQPSRPAQPPPSVTNSFMVTASSFPAQTQFNAPPASFQTGPPAGGNPFLSGGGSATNNPFMTGSQKATNNPFSVRR